MATNESIRVMVRFRPTNKSEQKKADQEEPWSTLQRTDKGIKMIGGQLSLHGIEQHGAKNIIFKKKKNTFYFNSLMDENTTQVEAFEKVAQQICDEIIQGYNGTIFVYGQSGSGKTHTMYGAEEKKDSMDIESMGIIPQACAYIFEILNNKHHPLVEGMLSYQVQTEFIEIYNEKIKDLLDLNNKPEIKEICINAHKDEWRVITKNVQRRQVCDLQQVLKAIRYATKHRTVAGTNLNATSSRSHMVMKLIVKIETAEGIRTGIANFSDLAGSEKVKKTGAKGKQLQEAKSILLSLHTLSRVIETLIKKQNAPFKESKLTFMLKDSLGGNCKTTLVITCSPHVFNRDETERSLRFGEQCRKVQNKAKINAVRTKSQLIGENEDLRKQIEILNTYINNNNQEFVSIENPGLVKKERKETGIRIQELENTNQKLSDQIKELAQEKTVNDIVFEQLNNQFEDLKFRGNELEKDVNEGNKEIEGLNKQIIDIKNIKQKLIQQTKELSSTSKKLNETNKELNIENERLQQTSKKQTNDMNKLKTEHENMKQKQIALNEKWNNKLSNNKSQYSKQEMELGQRIQTLQLECEQLRQSESGVKLELEKTQNVLKEKQNNIHCLEDMNRKQNDELMEEKEKNVDITAKNEELKLKIEELMSELNEEKMK
eukprot:101504_1